MRILHYGGITFQRVHLAQKLVSNGLRDLRKVKRKLHGPQFIGSYGGNLKVSALAVNYKVPDMKIYGLWYDLRSSQYPKGSVP